MTYLTYLTNADGPFTIGDVRTLSTDQTRAAADNSIDSQDEKFIQTVQSSVERLLRKYSSNLEEPLSEALGDPKLLAESFVSAMPKPSPWSKIIGPVYTGASLAKVLKVSRQTISERAAKDNLISLRTSDGPPLFPRFQFNDQMELIRGLPKVWKVLRSSGADEWMCASWLVAPREQYANESSIKFLLDGGDLHEVLREAKETRDRWSH